MRDEMVLGETTTGPHERKRRSERGGGGGNTGETEGLWRRGRYKQARLAGLANELFEVEMAEEALCVTQRQKQ